MYVFTCKKTEKIKIIQWINSILKNSLSFGKKLGNTNENYTNFEKVASNCHLSQNEFEKKMVPELQ